MKEKSVLAEVKTTLPTRKLIKIRVGNSTNKGDMMMLLAILDKLRGCDFCVEWGKVPRQFAQENYIRFVAPRKEILAHHSGLMTMMRRTLARLVDSLPSAILSQLGWVSNRKVEGVLDASGFAYGDQWGLQRIWAVDFENRFFKRLKRPIVYLPQSFGPFETQTIAEATQSMLSSADAIFARDIPSLTYLSKVLSKGRFSWAPDFTFNVKGALPSDLHLPDRYVCIVPNHRMSGRCGSQSEIQYVDFLLKCIAAVQRENVDVVIVNHDIKYDASVTNKLTDKLDKNVTVISDEDVRVLKAVIGGSVMTISSRFHGLINALFQGVPVIATQWTHKFPSIMDKYGCRRYLLEPNVAVGVIDYSVKELLNNPWRDNILEQITAARDEEYRACEAMWADVRAILEV